MTRKDYVAIAAAITHAQAVMEASRCTETAASALGTIAGTIADVMANDNPRFDRARFLKACGIAA